MCAFSLITITLSTASVAVISQTMAEKYWPHGNPIGERITIDKYLGPDFAAVPCRYGAIQNDPAGRPWVERPVWALLPNAATDITE